MEFEMKKFIFVVIFLAVCFGLNAQTATAPSSGDGTSGSPYQIGSLNNLYWIAIDETRWDKYYIQTDDIDASATSSWSGGEGWTPIGYQVDFGDEDNRPFTGSYDGDGYTISDLFINIPADSSVGLFGMTQGASIFDLTLDNVDITGFRGVGGLVGWNMGSTVVNCSVSGDVSGDSFVGGAIGTNFSGTIKICSFNGDVTSDNEYCAGIAGLNYSSGVIDSSYSLGTINGAGYVGGIVGFNYSSQVNHSFSHSLISGNNHVGGLVGCNDTICVISNCYASGSVSGNSYLGGLTGYNHSTADIEYSYSTGQVSNGFLVGGLVGDNDNDPGDITASFWDTELSGQSSSDGGTGKTTTQMQTQSTYTGQSWDFTDIWAMSASYNNKMPYLQWQTFAPEPSCATYKVEDTTSTTAIIYCSIVNLGSTNPSQHGVCWSESSGPTTEDSKTMEGEASSAGTFTSKISDMSANTTYYVRAYAHNASGTAYGNEISFTSLDPTTVTFTNGSSFSASPSTDAGDQALGRFYLTTDLPGAVLQGASIKLNGTRTGLSNFKLWESENDAFNSDVDLQIGSTVESDPGDGASVSFSGFDAIIPEIGSYYFLTADLASGATGGVQGFIVENASLTLNGGNLDGTISNAPLSGSEVPLPVELSSFVAQVTQGNVQLSWTTESETENSHFLVYRDGEVIATVEGAGTTSETHSYSYTDALVEPGVHEYALADVTYGGEVVMHESVEVEVETEIMEADFVLNKAYPNPFNPTTVISMHYAVGSNAVLNIYNTQGVLVDQLVNGFVEAGTYDITWDASDMPSGVYIVKMIAGNVMQSQKIVLMK